MTEFGSTLLAFAWTAFLVELTPGPNMTYLALLSARRGVWTAAAAVVGVTVGLLTIGVAAALGFGEVVSRSRWLYETIRWAGVAYLLWLAYEAWRGASADAAQPPKAAARDAFRDGLVTNLLNPKAAVFYLSVLPAFTIPDRPYAGQAIALTVTYVAVATLIHAVIIIGAGQAARLLMNDSLRRSAGRIMGVALAAVALWLAWATRVTP